MDNLGDNFFENKLSVLTVRFEKMIAEGTLLYYDVDDLEDLLEHYIIQHKLEFAQHVVNTAKSQYPSNQQLAIKEAELLSLTEKYVEALDLLNSIAILENSNPDFHIVKAAILGQCALHDEAISSLQQALTCSSDEDDMIYMNLAVEYQNVENYPEAIKYLKKALDVDPNNEDALYELAYCYELAKNPQDGIDTFNKLIDRTPYNEHAWFNLGASYQAIGFYEKALVAFDYVIIIDEKFHAAYFNKANVLVQLEKYREAIDLYKKALDFEILDSLIYFYIGDCYDHLEEHRQALTYFQKALKKDETMAEAWLGASSSLDVLGRELEALEYAKKAIATDSDNGDYWCYLAGLQSKYDLPNDSIVSFETAIEMGYLMEDVWEDYAQLCLELKNDDKAQSIVDRGLSLHEENKTLLVYRAVLMYRQNNENDGFEILVQVIMQDPLLIEEFITFYPKGMEMEEIQFLIESMK